jgi:hypothetical protein
MLKSKRFYVTILSKTFLSFSLLFDIMCLPPERRTKMPDLKPYYQVKLTLLRCKLSFLENPPKNEDEQYAYDIIKKSYEINEKKIEMLDFDKNKKLLEDYYRWLDSRQK